MATDSNAFDQKRHSGVGVASFVLSLAFPLFLILAIAIFAFTGAFEKGGSERHFLVTAFAFILFCFLLGSGAALGLGIAGIMQRDCRRKYAFFATAITTIYLFLFLLIVILARMEGF
jgi:uncharacterized membrane protein YozB (DUF420 family)